MVVSSCRVSAPMQGCRWWWCHSEQRLYRWTRLFDNAVKMMADYTGKTTYTHNQGGEKKVALHDRLEEKGPLVQSVQLCG